MPDLTALNGDVDKLVRSIGIPPCPEALTRILRAMRDDEPDFRKIGGLIGSDVGLAAAVLKTVNSAFYGLRTKATTVSQALALLGLRNAAELVTGLLLREAFIGTRNKMMDEFWNFSSNLSLVTTWIASRVTGINHEFAYTFALFRDCGIAALMTAFKDYQPQVYGAQATNPESLLALEQARFGINHCTMGYKLAQTWSLPDETCQAVLYHHDFDGLIDGGTFIPDVSVQLIALALLAEWALTMHMDSVVISEWESAGAFALENLGLTQSEVDGFLPEIGQALTDHGQSSNA